MQGLPNASLRLRPLTLNFKRLYMADKTCRFCKKTYTKSTDEFDDGYCSFACWESDNCKMPCSVLEKESVEEILSFKN